jgi:Bacterial PH domain
MSHARCYRSKVDAPLAVLALAPLLLALYLVSSLPAPAGHTLVRLLAVCLLAGVLFFALWVLLVTHYTIDGTTLAVRSGPFRWVIALREIRAVTATRDPKTGPALSLERLRIEHADGAALLVSPRDMAAFLADLRARGVKV